MVHVISSGYHDPCQTAGAGAKSAYFQDFRGNCLKLKPELCKGFCANSSNIPIKIKLKVFLKFWSI